MPEVVRDSATAQPIVVGRYALFKELAAGGMATVHLGRLLGPVGFSRTIAVKRLHPQFAKDPDFVSMFLDEANLVSRIRHPNVVPTLDVVNSPTGLLLVMEYVHGESLSRLARKSRDAGLPMSPRLVVGLMSNVLLGLHAAHEARGNSGELLNIVHRDVSPQNVLVGADGVARVLDFGVAKAAGRSQTTREGQIKGKLAYMAPEQIRGKVDRRTDVFAAGVVLWELCAGRRMFDGENEGQIISRIIGGQFQPPSAFNPSLPPLLVAAIMRALAPEPDARFSTAREFAVELERAIGVASPSEVSDWVESLAKNELQERAQYIESMERASAGLQPARTDPPPPDPNAPPTAQSGKFPVTAPTPGYDIEFTEISSGASRTNNGVFVAEPAPSATRAWALALVLIVLALAGAGMLVFAIYRMKHADTVATPTPTPSASQSLQTPKFADPIASASASSVTSPNTASSANSAPSASAASANATSSADPSSTAPSSSSSAPQQAWTAWHPPPGTHPTSTGVVRPPASGAQVAPPPTAKPKNCDPPFTIDGQGHRHYKPECD